MNLLETLSLLSVNKQQFSIELQFKKNFLLLIVMDRYAMKISFSRYLFRDVGASVAAVTVIAFIQCHTKFFQILPLEFRLNQFKVINILQMEMDMIQVHSKIFKVLIWFCFRNRVFQSSHPSSKFSPSVFVNKNIDIFVRRNCLPLLPPCVNKRMKIRKFIFSYNIFYEVCMFQHDIEIISLNVSKIYKAICINSAFIYLYSTRFVFKILAF